MQTKNNNIFYHLVAFLTVAIWGTTFVSTKVLMLNGLSPAQIFTLRFSIAYVLMLAFNHRRLFADSWQDEAKMALLGITGGSLYFCSENEAMNFTTTTNTSLIVCSCPLFATLLVRLVYKDSNRIHIVQLLGSLLAFVGMIIVVLNGRFVLHLSPVGDALAFTAYVLGDLFAADEVNHGRLQSCIHHPQGVFLWCSYHLAILYLHSGFSFARGIHPSAGLRQSALSGLPCLYDLLPHVELVHLETGHGEGYQLGVFQPDNDDDFRFMGAWRADYPLFSGGCRLHPDRNVCGG